MKRRSFKLVLIFLFLIALFLPACSSASKSTPVGLADAVTGMVSVGEYELYYTCIGDGSPTVILEAGGGRDSTEWNLVMLYYRKYTRICAYDRANLGNSNSASEPRTYADSTRDLHALLRNAPIEGPYILVGHSGGGMIVRLYASQYPEDIAGLVLVDSAHPDMGDRMLAALPPKTAGEDKSLEIWRKYAAVLSSSDGRGPYAIEGMDMRISNELVRAVTSLGDLPLAVVSRSPNNPVLMPGIPSLPEAINTAFLQQWQDLQTELEGLSSNSTRFIADHSGHGIPEEEPRFVVDAIRYIVDEYRAEAGIVVPLAPRQADASSHVPVITGIAERRQWENGMLVIYEDISFTDLKGDAITVINNVVSASIRLAPSDDIIRTPAAEQQQGTILTTYFTCRREYEAVIEFQVFDNAGNVSNTEMVSFSCPAPKPYAQYIPIAEIALAVILVGAGIWLAVRYLRRRRAAATQA
jgi:pimeloyl-ACP methyl ester carboxylesterase